uniref:Uncharacterized protein n=2 Tax=Arundo donax TaxID=35708 RepID=A0A0A9BWZ0_ARUDO
MCRFSAVYSIYVHKNGLLQEGIGSNSLTLSVDHGVRPVSKTSSEKWNGHDALCCRAMASCSPTVTNLPTSAHDLPIFSATTNSRAHERTGARVHVMREQAAVGGTAGVAGSARSGALHTAASSCARQTRRSTGSARKPAAGTPKGQHRRKTLARKRVACLFYARQ